MIELGRTYRHPRNGVEVTVLRDDPDGYEIAIMQPGRIAHSRPHVHTDFDQAFVVDEGTAQVRVGRTRHVLTAGERLDLPRGTMHVDAWNEGAEPLRFRNVITPTPRFIPAYVDAVVTRLADGTLPDNQEIPVLQLAVIHQATDGQSFGPGPIAPQRALLPLLAAIGRRRGYQS